MDRYLWTSAEQRTLAIIWSADNGLLTAVVTKEVSLDTLQRRVGMYERMAPVPEEVTGGGPGNAVSAVNGEVARQFNPEYWMRKTQAEDLKNAKAFLQRGLLSTEGIENFNTWKDDILRSVWSVLLTGREN